MLLENENSNEEIRRAITPALRDDLRGALAGVERELAPVVSLSTQDLELLAVRHIGGFITLTGGNWSVEQRNEWIDQALMEFADLPASLVFGAVAQARRRLRFPNEFVVWVFNACERDHARLSAERDRIVRLIQISQESEVSHG